jgi:hypothetical protein
MEGQSGGRVEVTNYSLDGKKLRRNSLLRSLSVGIGFEATAKRPNRCELRGHLAIAPLYSAMEALARASIRGPYSTEDSGF